MMDPSRAWSDPAAREAVRSAGHGLQSDHDARDDEATRRTEMTEQVGTVLERLALRWGKINEYRLWVLRSRWSEVLSEPWVEAVKVERVDDEGHLVVSVPHSSSVRMELQRKGRRWRRLLDGCCRLTGYTFTDLVLDDPRKRPRAQKGTGRA